MECRILVLNIFKIRKSNILALQWGRKLRPNTEITTDPPKFRVRLTGIFTKMQPLLTTNKRVAFNHPKMGHNEAVLEVEGRKVVSKEPE